MVERDAERMNLTRLRDILDAYGADPRRWPAAERDAALALLSGSEEARALRDEAAALDTLLDTAQVPAPSPELMAAHKPLSQLLLVIQNRPSSTPPEQTLQPGSSTPTASTYTPPPSPPAVRAAS